MGKKSLFTAKYRVYWSETDAALIMHFSNFFRICERAEEDFLESIGLLSYRDRATGQRILLPRVHAECDFFAPLRPGDHYRVELSELNFGNKSIEYVWKIYNEDLNRESSRCRIVAAFYDEKVRKAVPIPENFKKIIMSYIEKES